MSLWQLLLFFGVLAAATGAFIWLVIRLEHGHKPKGTKAKSFAEGADHEVEHIFNNEFREELRNRGRLHFEKIIGENAMFLQQDLRLTTSQLNDYMKQEITRTLQEEFSKYEESIADAKQLAIESIQKTQEAIEQQRHLMEEQLSKEVGMEKERIIARFQGNLAQIVNHYIVEAVGSQIDLNDQLEYILDNLESNKKAIIEDIKGGA